MDNPTLSIILTAAKEDRTIIKALDNLITSAINFLKNDFELITIIPDDETINKASEYLNTNFSKIKWQNIRDPYKGKPFALNLGIKAAKGDYLLLTDGDVYITKNSVADLFEKIKDKTVGGVTGRPVSMDQKSKYWGFISHLLADGAHEKRLQTMNGKLKRSFFVMSGYLFLMRNIKLEIPADCLVEDAFISYSLFNKGYNLLYQPKAKVYVKYPDNIKDWFNQKARSVGGYSQLWSYNIVKNDTKVRSFSKELEFFKYPISYAKDFKEFLWSISLYILRGILWLKIFWDREVLKKDFSKTWVRIESTK